MNTASLCDVYYKVKSKILIWITNRNGTINAVQTVIFTYESIKSYTILSLQETQFCDLIIQWWINLHIIITWNIWSRYKWNYIQTANDRYYTLIRQIQINNYSIIQYYSIHMHDQFFFKMIRQYGNDTYKWRGSTLWKAVSWNADPIWQFYSRHSGIIPCNRRHLYQRQRKLLNIKSHVGDCTINITCSGPNRWFSLVLWGSNCRNTGAPHTFLTTVWIVPCERGNSTWWSKI